MLSVMLKLSESYRVLLKKVLWVQLMQTLLIEMDKASNYGKGTINDLSPYLVRYDNICQMANKQEPPPIMPVGRGRPKSTKRRNLMNPLLDYKEGVIAFAKHEKIPFTNNQAERDTTPIKDKLKVAGCFRTQIGAMQFTRIQGFISTVRKLRTIRFQRT